MAKRHWLDPLARRLLVATGQLPADLPRSRQGALGPAPPGIAASRPGVAPSPNPDGVASSGAADGRDEVIERELLALRLRQSPGLHLRSAEEVRHAAALGWRLDVNRATASDWSRLPGCRPEQIDLLLRLQAGGVQLSGPEDLARLLQLEPELLQSWLPLLEFRWYGEPPAVAAAPPPVDLNQASASQLQEQLQLGPERCQRLLRERRRRPFTDLADLQERLMLPAAVVEELIGRVRFGAGEVGPRLPIAPARRRP